MRFSNLLLGLAGVTSWALAQDDTKDLGSTLAGIKKLSKFYDLIKKYPDILLQLPNYGGVTIVAPSNDAFDNIPYTALNNVWDPDNKTATVPLLQYHILQGTVAAGALEAGPSVVRATLLDDPEYTNVTSGQNVVINKQGDDTVVFTTSMGTRCTVEETDIAFSGGLIQVVDNLLIPPARLGDTSHAFQLPNFLGSLYAADLMPGLSYRKNVTIFAPVDASFERVGGSLTNLTDDAFARIMRYHVVPDRVLVSSSLTNGTVLQTLAGPLGAGPDPTILIRSEGNSDYVNSAQIIQPNILIANGIMHLVSNVLNPEAVAVRPDPQQASQPPLFPVSSESNPFTSDLPCTVSCPVTTTTSSSVGTAATTTTDSNLPTGTSDSHAAHYTGHMAGAALGALGLGAGMAWL